MQILHTGNYHWVDLSSVRCSDSIVNLFDCYSLYHYVISKEVEEQAINLVGTESFSGLNQTVCVIHYVRLIPHYFVQMSLIYFHKSEK